ncbi:MAG: ABC transporter permease [Opitutales bacterium]
MGKLIFRRILEAVPVLLAVVTLTFFMVRLAPGSPFDEERPLRPEVREALEKHYGLDRPLYEQYVSFLGGLLRGDLGVSYRQPDFTVAEIVAETLPVSFELAVYALGIALCLGLVLGLVAAVRPNRWSDLGPMAVAMVGICLPSFVLGPLLILAFAIELDWFRAFGWDSARDRVLPALTLGLFFAAYIARLTRASMLEVRAQDYMRTALAKGMPFHRAYLKHGLRNALSPVVAYLGPAMAGLVSGSFVVESLYQVPGLGRYFVTAALDSDYTLILGVTVVYASLLIAFNLVADVVLLLLDPRVRAE